MLPLPDADATASVWFDDYERVLGNSQRAGLVFAGANLPGTRDRGIITGEALIDRNLSGLELAVLSACETGLGEVAGGEGVFGLQRAFHVAGTRDVIASLWKVPDTATAALMAVFYRHLWEEKLPPLLVLEQAQLTIYKHPERIAELAKSLRGPFKIVPSKPEDTLPPPTAGKTAQPMLLGRVRALGTGTMTPVYPSRVALFPAAVFAIRRGDAMGLSRGTNRRRAAPRRYPAAPSASSHCPLRVAPPSRNGSTTVSKSVRISRNRPPTLSAWTATGDPHVVSQVAPGDDWWNVFRDPAIPPLIQAAHANNLDLKTAGTRILQAKRKLNISAGNLFPQTQNATGDYAYASLPHSFLGLPNGVFPHSLDFWAVGFNTSWELDFWGRFRRQIESSDDDLGGSVEAYRDSLVTLTADVATNYVQVRTFQQRLALLAATSRFRRVRCGLPRRLADGKATALDVKQARTSLAQTESTIPPLMIGLRQANDRLCVLLGEPVRDLVPFLTEAPIPELRRPSQSAFPPTCCIAGPTSAAP